MGAAKFLVLVGGIAGIVSFFLPLYSAKDAGQFSAMQIVKGIDTVKEVTTGAAAAAVDAAETSGQAEAIKSGTKDVNEAFAKLKMVILGFYAPALLLLLIGVVAIVRKQFGRLGGFGSLLFGLIGLLGWFILSEAGKKLAEEGAAGSGIAVHIYLVSAALGVVGGLLALIKPERPVA